MTYKTLCEGIAAFIKSRDPQATVTPEAIWNISPSGEIWPIHALHDACVAAGMTPLLNPPESPTP